MRTPRAVALFSGGLDSTLAILVMASHGVEVEAIKFLTHFGCDISDTSSCGSNPFPAAEKFGFNIRLSHLGWKFVDIVKSPKYGHGKNMNPCIDCRLLMLREAGFYREIIGADFVITGEVVGQRPKSQMRHTMNMVDRECGLEGRLVRPLSGRLLPPTIPEKEGLIRREWLLDINGRSRQRQMELAAEFGLETYPSPAAGCLLTDKYYSKKVRDLFTHADDFDFNDLNLLNVGRQFRINDRAKLIVGRNENENDAIAGLAKVDDLLLEVKDAGSPISLLRGRFVDSDLEAAAAITARYSDQKHQDLVAVDVQKVNPPDEKNGRKITVKPADDSMLERYRI